MTLRTTKKTVTFKNPFVIGDFDEILPSGTYDVETEEELLEGLSFRAYRRILTVIRVPGKSRHQSHWQTLTINPNELDEALERDAVPDTASTLQARGQERSKETLKLRAAVTDQEAVDRAENEGMSVYPH